MERSNAKPFRSAKQGGGEQQQQTSIPHQQLSSHPQVNVYSLHQLGENQSLLIVLGAFVFQMKLR